MCWFIYIYFCRPSKSEDLGWKLTQKLSNEGPKNCKPISFDRLKPKNVPAKRIFSLWLSGKLNKFRGLPLARLSLCWFNVRVLVNTQPTVPNLMQKFDNLGRHVYLISCHNVTAMARGGGDMKDKPKLDESKLSLSQKCNLTKKGGVDEGFF